MQSKTKAPTKGQPKTEAVSHSTRPTAPGWWWWTEKPGSKAKRMQIIRDHANGDLLVGGTFTDADYQADNDPEHLWRGTWTNRKPATTALERFLTKRPDQPHPERTEWSEVTLPESLLRKAMKAAKEQGIDNWEDFHNKVLSDHFRELAFAGKLGAAIGDRVAEKLGRKTA